MRPTNSTAGLLHDRHWMLIDGRTRTFLSQRTHPQLALLHVTLHYQDAELEVRLVEAADGGDGSGDDKDKDKDENPATPGMATATTTPATTPTLPPLRIPIRGVVIGSSDDLAMERDAIECTVWKDRVHALDEGDRAAHWFQTALGVGSDCGG